MSHVGLSLGTRTRLSATPQMQQAVRLLQLSAADFAQEIEQVLAQNPFLEEVENEQGLDAAENSSTTAADAESGAINSDALAIDEIDRLSMQDDWRAPAHVDTASTDSALADAGDRVAMRTSLRTHLLEQICGWGLGEREQIAATIVVESLDEDGYLRTDIAESAAASGIDRPLSNSEIEQALEFVQSCDPTGVAARDLAECLALQLRALDEEPAGQLAEAIVSHHLQDLAHRRYAALRQALSCTDEALNLACALIRRLDPRPGQRFSAESAQYVVPDVIVRARGNELVAVVNPALRPAARLNQCYVQWFKDGRPQDHAALSQQLQEARWLMHNVDQRFVTIQRVADAIVRRQRHWFESGEIALKPLVLREVADDLGIHESTVSRATGNKYMDTPRGLFEFRHFFSPSLATETGGACSAAAVRALMSDMLAREPQTQPLSDVALARLLSQNGVRVSRRTVTKYRNLMKVAPVELRKRA